MGLARRGRKSKKKTSNVVHQCSLRPPSNALVDCELFFATSDGNSCVIAILPNGMINNYANREYARREAERRAKEKADLLNGVIKAS